ncbi:MAG TPA: 4-hydroxyphenylacetate 3-hydroxylase N-terminal domain-containing protein [Candidatus Bathyarchaeia archaeon]|nr:4-hydroxyphenylacetate 3-hydroxylase N-terminal domain-containing protein [Candidatus Bathyarchaeia archaeon]
MRTGSEYRETLRDGRRVWIMGEGLVEDVTVHPATRAMVDEYVTWYDRHHDPEWQARLLTPPDARGSRSPWAFAVPRTGADLRAMGRSYAATIFPTAGNMTHTPGYGNLIALGIHDVVRQRNVSPKQIDDAASYRDMIARTGRFLTFSAGAATIGYRLREDPGERAALRVVRETGAGLVLSGKVGMHTSPAYAEDVYIGAHSGVDRDGHRATFVVPVSAPGVTVLCRKIAARHPNPFLAPLSSRFDELDGQMWLDNVLVPWERVFLTEPSPDPIAAWCFWHQLYAWLAKAEFTLGLALACAHAMGLKDHEPTIEYLVDLVVDVQTVRSCQTAAELDPDASTAGYCMPGRAHVAAGSIAMQKARQRMAEILRIVPGSSLVVAPSDKDLTSPEVGTGLEESFGGGEYTALQRAALLQLAADHVASALDGRESAFELHANGGLSAWRARLRRAFTDYNDLANGVVRALSIDMPAIDLDSLRAAPLPQRRPAAPASQPKRGPG